MDVEAADQMLRSIGNEQVKDAAPDSTRDNSMDVFNVAPPASAPN